MVCWFYFCFIPNINEIHPACDMLLEIKYNKPLEDVLLLCKLQKSSGYLAGMFYKLKPKTVLQTQTKNSSSNSNQKQFYKLKSKTVL